MKNDIAKNIKAIIKNQRYLQGAIAERAGFSQKQFSDMLNGRKLILAEHIPRIANALNVTPNELCGWSLKEVG